jgi:glycine/D-amino acid oxidase-like deaminating enzyme
MVKMMNRSIDLMEELAEAHQNVFHLNQRGYLYTTTNPDRIADLEGFGREAESLGAGELRLHPGYSEPYHPNDQVGFRNSQTGADLITDRGLITQHFPYLSEKVVGVLHVRRAGWLSAQQYGMLMLDQAKLHGAVLVNDRVVGVSQTDGSVDAIFLASGTAIYTKAFVNAAGPLLAEVSEMLEIDIPIHHELHQKASIDDLAGAVGREAPLLIDIDRQYLDWQEEDRQLLAEDEESAWLLDEMPSGAHVRPEGADQAHTILMLWDTHTEQVSPILPAPVDPFYGELAVRGLSKMLPLMETYLDRIPKAYIDSGYYTKTDENRPLAGEMGVPGAYLIGAMSGFGIMAAAGLGEVTAAHVAGEDLPEYASAFSLDRYNDSAYQALLDGWGDSWQL